MITIENLWYVVGGKQILKGVNLIIPDGQIMAIMGVSGGGKTSLLKCIGGLVEGTAGSLQINGQEMLGITENKKALIRDQIGMVFQYAALFDSLTVYENIAFPLRWHKRISEKEIRSIVKEQLSRVGMEDTEDLLPAELSGGMQKRVGLARALAQSPKILLYDEPTSGLDPVIAGTIDELIVRTCKDLGVTSVVVSHDVSSIFRTANHIAMLHNGCIEQMGTPEEIRQSKNPAVVQFIHGDTEGPIQAGSVG